MEKISKRYFASPKEEICQFGAKGLGRSPTSAKLFNESWFTLEPIVKAADQACLKGYPQKWNGRKTLVGSAMYDDVLKPLPLLNLSLRNDGVDIIQGIKHILNHQLLCSL